LHGLTLAEERKKAYPAGPVDGPTCPPAARYLEVILEPSVGRFWRQDFIACLGMTIVILLVTNALSSEP
jgi:hypothetical protein